MNLSSYATNRLVDEAAALLDAGSLRIYESGPSASLREALVSVPFQSPAFGPSDEQGQAIAHELPATPIALTGEARWGEFVTATGTVFGDLKVRAVDADDAADADVVLDRTDFHRGGLCTIARVVLRLPRSS